MPDPDGNPTVEEKLATAEAKITTLTAEGEASKKALEEQKITVKVDGTDKEMTMDEAREALSKVGGADKKFQEAADIRKKAERGMKIDSLFAQLNEQETPDNKLVMELAGVLGIDPAPFLPSGSTTPAEPSKKVTLEDLDPNLKNQLEYDAQRNIRDAEAEIKGMVKKGVDKDEIIGRMNSVAKEAGNEDFLAAAVDEVHKDVLRKIRGGEPLGPDMVASSIQAARAQFKKYGIPEKVTKPKTLIYGVGQPGGEPLAIQPDEPIERVESSEAGYTENFAKRIFQDLAKGRASM